MTGESRGSEYSVFRKSYFLCKMKLIFSIYKVLDEDNKILSLHIVQYGTTLSENSFGFGYMVSYDFFSIIIWSHPVFLQNCGYLSFLRQKRCKYSVWFSCLSHVLAHWTLGSWSVHTNNTTPKQTRPSKQYFQCLLHGHDLCLCVFSFTKKVSKIMLEVQLSCYHSTSPPR